MGTRWYCWRPLSSGTVFGARSIERLTGRGWGQRRGGRAKIGIPVSKCRSKTFTFTRYAQEQTQRTAPLSQEVLEEALAQERAEQRQRAKERTRRHLPPVELEKQQIVLEPEDKICPTRGQERPRIGQEVTTEYDYVPAKLIIREIVRPKYGSCQKPCCQGVAIAALPPRLVPQSKLGLGLAVYLLLSRFDDHVAYYTLERNFRERFGVVITRQQMVQWVEKVAHLLLAIYWLIWEELKVGDYLQIDESPVKVLDPEVKGKAAQGYLWFYSTPGG